jgi:hypothetical protein
MIQLLDDIFPSFAKIKIDESLTVLRIDTKYNIVTIMIIKLI